MTGRSFEQFLHDEWNRDSYLKALWDATHDARDLDEFDTLLAAFPERDDWERQQQQHSQQPQDSQ